MPYEKFSPLLPDHASIGTYIALGMVGSVDFLGGRVVGHRENGLQRVVSQSKERSPLS